MNDFEVLESDKFKLELEEAVLWLYSFNLEQSQEFADKKHLELQQEVDGLKSYLKQSPRMGQADDAVAGLRRFPLYGGRYIATWIVGDTQKKVILLGFLDSRYPKELRKFDFED